MRACGSRSHADNGEDKVTDMLHAVARGHVRH